MTDAHRPATAGDGGAHARAPADVVALAAALRERIPATGLFRAGRDFNAGDDLVAWRLAPGPLAIDTLLLAEIRDLGSRLSLFLRSINRLYLRSRRGKAPPWIAEWLDRGVPDHLTDYARRNRFRTDLPRVIRPDVILGPDRPDGRPRISITELDSVPGGIGLLGCLSEAYAAVAGADEIVGGADGMVRGFRRLLAGAAGHDDPATAIVVSDEAADYRPEMEWLAGRCRDEGTPTVVVHPADLAFADDGFRVPGLPGDRRVEVIYRFFELFDLRNIARAELMMYAANQRLVAVTPPFKHHLEEKMLFALLHHPALAPEWNDMLGPESFDLLRGVMPPTWVLDPRALPPHAVIPGLAHRGRAVRDWSELESCSQSERSYMIKISGFSDRAWGSRGVWFGSDLSHEDWTRALRDAIAGFDREPAVLQEYRKARRFPAHYIDPDADRIRTFHGRARLCPYFLVGPDDEPELAGILATVCPGDKKILHGMRDAVMIPCVENPDADPRVPDALGGELA